MDSISQQAFIQALGWATLNSFWQAGLLWCGFVALRRWGVLNPGKQYNFSVAAIFLSFLLFVVSFCLYLSPPAPLPLFALFGAQAGSWLPLMLTSASVSYLIILAVPLIRLARNWAFLHRLRQTGLGKADVSHRLFVCQTAHRMGIKKSVAVSFSPLIQTPLTIGFLKPIILLPIATFNQLTLRQAEAVLLHELAHIRRHDFFLNIFICIIHTLLYFNPFVRLFVRAAENSREDCCDATVLQFGYDSFAYASALLQLEKSRQPLPAFVLSATGRKQLLSRIENIVGLPSVKPTLRLHHLGGLLASVLLVLALHSLVFRANEPANEEKLLMDVANPFAFTYETESGRSKSSKVFPPAVAVKNNGPVEKAKPLPPTPPAPVDVPMLPQTLPLMQVAQMEDALAQLTAENRQAVQEMVQNTKRTLRQFKWQELEKSIGDALTVEEKASAHKEYISEIDKINWDNLAQNMAANFEHTDWQKLQGYIQMAEAQVKQDSLAAVCNRALCEVEALQTHLEALNATQERTHLKLAKAQKQLKQKRDSLTSLKYRPIIKL